MKITKEWVIELALRHGKSRKEIRDALWPNTPTKSLSYLDHINSVSVKLLIQIADAIGCSVDELLRRTIPVSQTVSGNYNQIGNVNITNDPQSLQQIIVAQQQIINHQEAEIKRMEANTKEQLKVKDQQINDLGKRIDRLIEIAQGTGGQ